MEGKLRAQKAKLSVQRDHAQARAEALDMRLAAMMPMLRQQADEVRRLKRQNKQLRHSEQREKDHAAAEHKIAAAEHTMAEQHKDSIARMALLRDSAEREKADALRKLEEIDRGSHITQMMLEDNADGTLEMLSELEAMRVQLKVRWLHYICSD